MTIKFSDITGGGIPYGDNAGRPANPGIGKLYSNGEAQRLELYTSNGTWENIIQEVPGVASISGNYSEASNSGTITIYGTNFVNGAYATAIGSNGSQINATSTVFNSLVQLTATFTGLSNQYEPYSIKVTNPSNLFGILPEALYVNAVAVWQTPAGSLGSFGEQVSISVSATAIDDSTITYSLASGSSLPSGVTLNSSTGVISGTLPDISTYTTYTFTINASDGVNPAVPRTFSITSDPAPAWVTASGALSDAVLNASYSTTVSATDNGSFTYAIHSGSLPTGLTINSSTGVISGTPTVYTGATTPQSFTLKATDNVGNISTRAFTIAVLQEVYATFTSSQSWTVPSNVSTIDYIVVGGGGTGAGPGSNVGASGGGAGGMKIMNNQSVTPGAILPVVIGAGGTGWGGGGDSGYGLRGGTSSFNGTSVTGGGGGGAWFTSDQMNGGSGGGASGSSGGSPGTGISGEGNNGGSGRDQYGWCAGGGKGSAGSGTTPGSGYTWIDGIVYAEGGVGNGGGSTGNGPDVSSTKPNKGFGGTGRSGTQSSTQYGSTGVVKIKHLG